MAFEGGAEGRGPGPGIEPITREIHLGTGSDERLVQGGIAADDESALDEHGPSHATGGEAHELFALEKEFPPEGSLKTAGRLFAIPLGQARHNPLLRERGSQGLRDEAQIISGESRVATERGAEGDIQGIVAEDAAPGGASRERVAGMMPAIDLFIADRGVAAGGHRGA